jgi:hypothetical protein
VLLLMLGIDEPEVTNGVEPVRLFCIVAKLTIPYDRTIASISRSDPVACGSWKTEASTPAGLVFRAYKAFKVTTDRFKRFW